MKILPNKTFPHPVLSQHADDYPKRKFQPALDFVLEGDIPVLTVTFNDAKTGVRLNEEKILGLVKDAKADYVVEINCPTTYLRRVFSTREDVLVCRLGSRELHRQVEVNVFVISTSGVEGFSSPNFNAEFGDSSFNIEAGDVLAVAPVYYYWWDTGFRAPLSSVFELVASSAVGRGRIAVDTGGEKIRILMHEEDKQRFNIMRSSSDSKGHAMFVYFSALAEVLRRMMAGDEEENSKWYRAVEHKLGELGKQIDKSSSNPFELAQDLLRDPFGFILPPKLED